MFGVPSIATVEAIGESRFRSFQGDVTAAHNVESKILEACLKVRSMLETAERDSSQCCKWNVISVGIPLGLLPVIAA